MDDLTILRWARQLSTRYVVIDNILVPYITVGEAIKYLGGTSCQNKH